MTGYWILVLIAGIMYPVQSGRHGVMAQSSTPDVYQSDKKLSVDIGASATLDCCIFGTKDREIIFFKQQNRKQPRIVVRFFKASGEKFYNEFQNSRFQIKQRGNCFNMTISNTTLSDEAVYYCALVSPSGTDLKIKGQSFTTESETSKPALCDHNTNTQEETALALGTALGLCALLIFCLVCFILTRRKRDKIHTSIEDSPGMKQESDAEMVTYAALQFAKRKAKAEKRKTGFSEDCIYSGVK